MKRSWLAIATVVPLTFGALGDVEAEYEGEGRQPRVLSMPEEGPEPSARPFHMNLDELVSNNQLYRDVVFTGRMSQIALMSIPPGDHIGYETHDAVEQIIVVHSGSGRLTIDGDTRDVGAGDVIVVPPGTPHDIVNTGESPLRLYTIYTPPNHIAGRKHPTREAAEADVEDEAFGRNVGQKKR